MAKSSVSDWDTTAANNTDVGNIGIAGSSSIRLGDNAFREVMAQIASYTRAGADLASASTLNLDSIDSLWLAVTGTTTVTAVTLTEGHVRFVRATGAFQMTAGSSLIVNGSTSTNYTTTAGDLLFFEGYGSSVVRVWVISGAPATQTEQEAGTVTNKFVTPAVQQFHPSAAKCWVVFDSTSGVAAASYNLASMADGGTGSTTINIATDFSSGTYAAVATAEALGAVIHVYATTTNAGSCTVSQFSNGGSAAEGTGAISVVMFGDQ